MVQGKSQNICRMFRNHSYFTLKPSRMDFHWHLFCFGKFNDLMYIHVCCKFPISILQTREGVGVLYLTQTFRDVLNVWQGIDRSTSHAYSYWYARFFLFRFNVGVHLNGYDDWHGNKAIGDLKEGCKILRISACIVYAYHLKGYMCQGRI